MNNLSESAKKSFRWICQLSDNGSLKMHPESTGLKATEKDFEEIEAAGLAIFRNDEYENVIATITRKGIDSVA